MKHRFLDLIIILYLSTIPGYTELYKCLDSSNNTTYTNVPCPNDSKSEIIEKHGHYLNQMEQITDSIEVDTPDNTEEKFNGLGKVRTIYLVSSDRIIKEEYRLAIEHALIDVQRWYANQLDGKTFMLNNPIVEVVKSKKPY